MKYMTSKHQCPLKGVFIIPCEMQLT